MVFFKHNKFFGKILYLIFLFFIISCYDDDDRLLGKKHIFHFKLIESHVGNKVLLNMSGLIMHSALAVKKIESKVEDDNIAIDILLSLSRKGLSGDFSYQIEIPPYVNKVFLGKSKDLIWERKY